MTLMTHRDSSSEGVAALHGSSQTALPEVPAQKGLLSGSQNATKRERHTEAHSRKPNSSAGWWPAPRPPRSPPIWQPYSDQHQRALADGVRHSQGVQFIVSSLGGSANLVRSPGCSGAAG